MQAVVTFASISAKHARRNPFSIIANAKPKIFFVVTDFHFHLMRRRMTEGIAQGPAFVTIELTIASRPLCTR
jgi:NaMN:DMB phosphoribosyltransferase